MTMDQLYITNVDYCNSPMSFANVPDLGSSYDDITTDPSPSPPVMFSSLDNHYRPYSASSTLPIYLRQQQQTPQNSIVNSIEFTDLTNIHAEDSQRRRRRSTTAQDKEAATNMRIRRRAQNRASQRAFRERKERHVQHLEQELESLEMKHQNLEKSYSEVEGAHAKLQREVEELREALATLRGSSVSGSSREGSIARESQTFKLENNGVGAIDQEHGNLFEPFGSEDFFA